MDQAGIIRREQNSYPCEACHKAPGAAFTDRRWLCRACTALALQRLALEPMQPTYRVQASSLPQECIDKIRAWRARA